MLTVVGTPGTTQRRSFRLRNLGERLGRWLVSAFSTLADRRVVSNVRWTFAGNVLYAASQWAMVLVLARATDPQTVGTLALALAITAPIMIFFNMQLRAVVATDVTGKYTFAEYVRSRLVTSALGLVAILLCVLMLHQTASTVAVIILIGLSKAAESCSDIIHGYWQLVERMDRVGKSLTIRAVLTLTTFAVAISITRNLVWASAAFLVGSAGVLLGYDAIAVRRALAEAARARAVPAMPPSGGQGTERPSLIRLALPLGCGAMIISLNAAIPRYFIELYCGKHQLGIFAVLAYFLTVGNLAMNAVGQSVLPRLARLFSPESPAQFGHLLTGLLTFSVAVAAASMAVSVFFGRPLLLIYGREYADAYPTFLIVMAAAAIGYVLCILNFVLIATGAYNIQAPLSFAVTVTLVVLCVAWIPSYGITGAAVAMMVGGAVQGVASVVYLAVHTRPLWRKAPVPCL